MHTGLATTTVCDRRACKHAGVPLVVDFAEKMTPAQHNWLRRAALPLRSISFDPLDEASMIVWQQV